MKTIHFQILEVRDKKKKKNDYHLYINGQAVPVSEEVCRVYKRFERKEEYFTYDLKAERFSKKTASFLPSREDSYERLLETNQQFAIQQESVQDQVENLLDVELVKKALSFLNPEERELINLLFYQEKTEQEVGILFHISQQAVNKRKQVVLIKLRKLLKEFYEV